MLCCTGDDDSSVVVMGLSFSEQMDAPTDEYFLSRVFCERCFSMLDALQYEGWLKEHLLAVCPINKSCLP